MRETNKHNPFQILHPNQRWAPTQSQFKEVQSAYEKLLPPLVHKVRMAVKEWRDKDYAGASRTSKALLQFWFDHEHKVGEKKFQFYFAQRESIESIIYLYEIAKAKDKYELMRFDSSGRISTGMFDENWTRYVVKMATGTGKTKVMTLTLTWSYFHKLYEQNSPLSKNILIIAPNIIVLNRLRKDFNDLKIFNEEPFIPDNGFDDRNWKNDFQPTLHIQDDLKPISESGNIFLTNIHRVYWQEDQLETFEDMFLGNKPKPDADKSKGLDLGKLLRSSKIKDLSILNDEAHHIHDPSLQWFKSIEDISNKLKLKQGSPISLQADFTATPRHNNGAIFVQTITDYPLVEAIHHNVVKSPVLPDEASRAKLVERDSQDFIERYQDYLHLGYLEWEKQHEELSSVKTPILFVMTNNTSEADDVAAWLERTYPLLNNSVLTIHTNRKGEIKETGKSKKDKEELEKLRKAADDIDKDFSTYKAVVSVLMLREGWDVKNVTTIVGLRPYKAKSNILPEQTLGRGLRKMFWIEETEKLVVVGTPRFLEFVEELKAEGVEFEYSPMGKGTQGKSPIIVEVDEENEKKDLEQLDIPLPVLSPRVYREYKNLELLDVGKLKHETAKLKRFDENELKEIVFTDIDGKFSHKTQFEGIRPDYRNVLGFFTQSILKSSLLVGGFHILYPKVESFVKYRLFGKEVNLSNPQVIRNLSELEAKTIIYETFKKAIDDLTISDKGTAEVRRFISLKDTKPNVVDNQPFLRPKRSIFNKLIGDNQFELEFAAFLDKTDILAFAKNHQGIGFRMEYQSEDGNIREYYPDFFVKRDEHNIRIIETKGREDLDDLRKVHRLWLWCRDVNAVQEEFNYTALYVKQDDWEKKQKDIRTFADMEKAFAIKKAMFEKIVDKDPYAVINRGADVSQFGDPVEWQREERKDRKIDLDETD